MLLLTAYARVIGDREMLLRAALATGFALNMVTAYVIAGIFRRWFEESWAWLAGAAWLLSPLAYSLAGTGLESSLYALGIALTVLVWVRWVQPAIGAAQPTAQIGGLAALGACLGFTVMARTEGAVLVASVLVVLFALTAKQRPALRRVVFNCAVVAFVTALVCAPAALYSLQHLGTFSQDSAAMKMLWRTHNPSDQWAILTSLLDTTFGRGARFGLGPLPWLAVAAVGFAFQSPRSTRGATALTALGVAGAVVSIAGIPVAGGFKVVRAVYGFGCPIVLAAGLVGVWRIRPAWGPVAAFLLLAAALQTVSCGLFLADFQSWYVVLPGMAAFIVIAAMIVGWAGSRTAAVLRAHRAVPALLVVLLLAALARFCVDYRAGTYPWQRDVYTSQQVIDRTIPPGARIGCFNAGIPAYFSDRFIINLDGLVNHAIHPYYLNRNVDEYLRLNRIDYICDEDLAMDRAAGFMSRPLDKQDLGTFPLTRWPSKVRHVWRLRR